MDTFLKDISRKCVQVSFVWPLMPMKHNTAAYPQNWKLKTSMSAERNTWPSTYQSETAIEVFWWIFNPSSCGGLPQVAVISSACLFLLFPPLIRFWYRGQCGIPHLPHCSYEEQMRIGGMKGDQQWGDKPWDGRVRGRGGDSEIDRKGEETVGETKQGAEHVCRVTRHEPGWIQVKRLRHGNRGGEGEEDE